MKRTKKKCNSKDALYTFIMKRRMKNKARMRQSQPVSRVRLRARRRRQSVTRRRDRDINVSNLETGRRWTNSTDRTRFQIKDGESVIDKQPGGKRLSRRRECSESLFEAGVFVEAVFIRGCFLTDDFSLLGRS